jgi:hypothetical protein
LRFSDWNLSSLFESLYICFFCKELNQSLFFFRFLEEIISLADVTSSIQPDLFLFVPRVDRVSII